VDAILVFTSAMNKEVGRWYLDKNFQHCFVVLNRHFGWTLYDPLPTGIQIVSLGHLDGNDIIAKNISLGHSVLAGNRPRQITPTTNIRTCVSIAKCLIGLEALWVQTPWQLHRHCLRVQNFRPFFQ
jgi:hypothetical protein